MNPDKPKSRIVCDRITRDSKGRIVVTDWDQSVHRFRDPDKALAYAAGMYQRKPKTIAAKHGTPARWANPPRPIVWHYERHSFSSGRAIKSH